MLAAMDLYLVRHATAEPRAAGNGASDASRALTREGRRKFRGVRAGLERMEVRFDRLLHSPLLRAVETAELLMPLVDGPATAEPGLAAAPSEGLLARLAGDRVALVGHQPWLGDLLAWLTMGDPAHGHAFEWKKGGVARLTGDPHPGGMHLAGFLPPGVLRRIGRR
jgi:phosphohistidine phosphatase